MCGKPSTLLLSELLATLRYVTEGAQGAMVKCVGVHSTLCPEDVGGEVRECCSRRC